MRPDGHRQAGTRNHPFARRGHPWARMGTRKRREGCVARGKACGHRVGSIPGSDGKVHRFEGRARPCALIDARIRRRAPAIPEEAAALGALRYRHRREGRTRSPRCATRSARWASGSAVKGRPFMSLRIPVKCDIDPASTAGRPREQGDIHPLAERVTRAGRATRRDRIGGEHESDGRFWIASHGTS